MNTVQRREQSKNIESQIGWKAKRELIRSIQEKGYSLLPGRQEVLRPV